MNRTGPEDQGSHDLDPDSFRVSEVRRESSKGFPVDVWVPTTVRDFEEVREDFLRPGTPVVWTSTCLCLTPFWSFGFDCPWEFGTMVPEEGRVGDPALLFAAKGSIGSRGAIRGSSGTGSSVSSHRGGPPLAPVCRPPVSGLP